MSRIRIVITTIFFILFLFGFHQVKAQVKAGVRAGLNYPNLSVLEFRENNGFHIGTYLKLSLAGIVALEPGIQYSHREFSSEINNLAYEVDLNYIEVPLLFRMSIFPFVNIFGGPQASVLVKEKFSGSFDSMGNLPDYEMGGVAGIGVKLPLGFNIQGSYDFGLSDVESNGQVIKNRLFKLSLGKDF